MTNTEQPWRHEFQPGERNDATITMPRSARDLSDDDWALAHPLVVDQQVVRALARSGMETIHAYYLLRTWQALGEEVSAERYLREVWYEDPRDPSSAMRLWPLRELAAKGLIVTPEAAEERHRDRLEIMYGSRWMPGDPPSQRSPRKRKPCIVVPDPFPAFVSSRRWAGAREPLAVGAADPVMPARGVSVVYWLYDDAGVLAYVGSTGDLITRLAAHWQKPHVRFEAAQCADRESAYWLEALAVITGQPYLNRDDSVGGRVKPLLLARGRAALQGAQG